MAEEEAQKEAGEGTEEGQEGEEGEAKKKSKLPIILAGVVVILLVAGVFLSGVLSGDKEEEVAEEETISHEVVDKEASTDPVFFDLDELLVNLNSSGKQPNFLKVTITLEVPGDDHLGQLKNKLPRVLDSFQIYLRELRKEDLQGSAGLYRIREELLLRINKVVYPTQISDILFKQILVQ